ncbi:MAG: putative MAPEG superfamily protein [Alphaproteobacteria bacterium]|jgi:uncharacterized MAPEG superfamily protein
MPAIETLGNIVNTTQTATLWGIFIIVTTVAVQSIVASFVKASSKGHIPGKIDSALSHDSLIFRTYRTFQNSLENVPIMLATCFLAIFANADTSAMCTIVWVYAIARIMHMALYYLIATEKNPSPRSIFFMIGLFANIALLIHIATTLAA